MLCATSYTVRAPSDSIVPPSARASARTARAARIWRLAKAKFTAAFMAPRYAFPSGDASGTQQSCGSGT